MTERGSDRGKQGAEGREEEHPTSNGQGAGRMTNDPSTPLSSVPQDGILAVEEADGPHLVHCEAHCFDHQAVNR